MTQPSVTITHSLINSGNPVTLQCNRVTAGNKRSLNAKPNANVDGPVEVQGKASENRKISLPAVYFDTGATIVTAEEMEDLLQLEYDGTNAPILTVTYGKTGSETLKSMTGSTSIPVILESYNYPIDVSDTKGGYMPIGSMTFIETIANS